MALLLLATSMALASAISFATGVTAAWNHGRPGDRGLLIAHWRPSPAALRQRRPAPRGPGRPGPDVPLVERHHPFRRLFLAPSHPMAVKDLPAYDRDVAKPRRCWTRPVCATQRRRNPGPVWRPAVRAGAAHRQPVLAQDRRAVHGVPPRGERPGQDHQLGRGLGRRGHYARQLRLALTATAPWVGTRTPPLRIRLSARVPAKSFCSTFGSQFEDLAARQAAKLDPSRRKEAVQQIQRIVAEDAPLIPFTFPPGSSSLTSAPSAPWYSTPGGVWGHTPVRRQAGLRHRDQDLEGNPQAVNWRSDHGPSRPE